MYVVVWAFEVSVRTRGEFERAYASGGDWARLFRRSTAYQGTELLHDQTAQDRYLTIDRWTSRQAFDAFALECAAEYAALDRRCESLTLSEALVGQFEGLV